jgi:hypothetical protein
MTTTRTDPPYVNSVVINAHGESTTPRSQAPTNQLMQRVEVIFVRDDHWTLGASRNLAGVARQQWPDRWIERWEWWDGAWRKMPL